MNLLLAFLAGLASGAFFYGGLWLTVRRLGATSHPVLLMFFSFWGRTVVTIAAILSVAQGRWENAVVAVGGFTAARVALSALLPNRRDKPRCA